MKKLTPAKLKQLCIDLEHWETDPWAASSILNKIHLTKDVLDPCVGTGILAEAAIKQGYSVQTKDIYDWGYRPYPGKKKQGFEKKDFLSLKKKDLNGLARKRFSIFMNPPFSKACDFVIKAHELGAEKILSFQRFAWWESWGRKEFWEKYPPNEVFICGNRASCWRHDIPKKKRKSGSPTAHAWFYWDKRQQSYGLPFLNHVWNDE